MKPCWMESIVKIAVATMLNGTATKSAPRARLLTLLVILIVLAEPHADRGLYGHSISKAQIDVAIPPHRECIAGRSRFAAGRLLVARSCGTPAGPGRIERQRCGGGRGIRDPAAL